MDITVTVDVGPIGSATLPRSGGERRIPRFASDESAAVTVIDVESSTDHPRGAVRTCNALGFDTGFAISNMNTKDDQSGAITFMLYQNGEEPIEYTTTMGTTPGRGHTSGVLEAGATYAVLLSEVLDAAEELGDYDGGPFSGYAKIVTDFTLAEGVAYISDWAAFTATATLRLED